MVRRYKVGGLKAIFNKPSPKQIINRINTPSSKKKILYITITPSFNLLRQSIYIRKNGNYETILLMENPWLLKLMEKHFDTVYIYDTYYELANILKEAKPHLIHVQGSMLGSDFLCIFAKLLSKIKFIFEFFDVPSLCVSREDSVGVWGKRNTELGFFAEQYACENADGVILGYSREAADILKQRYNIKSPILEFHTYICNEFISTKKTIKYSQEDGKIHLVYGGNVAPSNLPKKVFADVQFHEIIKEITKQGFYFDIYTTPHVSPVKFEQFFSDYIAISKENNLFGFMKGLSLDKAPNEFSRYDFGMMVYLFNQGTFLNESLNTRLPGKFFLYLEAGLPILISEEFKYVAKIVREYEIGIVVSQKDIYNLSKIIPTYDYEKLKNNVVLATKKLSMETHINTLLKFYEDCPG
ncbi:MAG: hypothetical protein HUU08_11930 [Candidatus Brocadia sp.]|nr:hypothetical protein [Candidatus Brocadia sp.]